MKIVIVTATEKEVNPLFQKIDQPKKKSARLYSSFIKDLAIDILVTGVGMPSTIFHLTQHLALNPCDLIINTGIAGSYNDLVKTGTVVHVTKELFVDLGIDDNGHFKSIFEAGLMDQNISPFMRGELISNSYPAGLPSLNGLLKVKGATLNTASGNEKSINKIIEKFHPDVETMEGAAVFFVALQMNTPFFQIRGIANKVESRNVKNWNLPLAIINVNERLFSILGELQ